MKSFIKSHRKSGSNPPEQEHKPPVTPKLNHSASAFSLRQKTPTSSPTLYNSSAFTTSPLPPPPPPFLYRTTSPSSQSSSQIPFAESGSGNKRSILKGLLKHKSSKTSLSSPGSKPNSPVVASKSFVTFSDSSLPLPSQTPEFVVDRPNANVSYLNIINEEKASAPSSTNNNNKKFFRNNNDSLITTSTITSNEDLSLGNKLNVQTTNSSTGLESAAVIGRQLNKLNTVESVSINKSQYSFQSSKVEFEISETMDSDAESQKSSGSSQFSFEANKTYGRKTSIKYYKKQEDIDRQQSHIAGRKFIQEFIGEDVDVTDLQDDLNYDDSDVEDDTQDLFNRKLFSSDEEDDNIPESGEVTDEVDQDDENDFDDYLDDVNEELSEDEDIGGEASQYEIEDNLSLTDEPETPIENRESLAIKKPKEEENFVSVVDGQKEHSRKQVKFDTEAEETHQITNNISKRMSQMTVEPNTELIMSHMRPNMGATQRNKLGLNLRTKSVKYHQLTGSHEDDLKFLNTRYSWYVRDEEALRIQQKLHDMGNEDRLNSSVDSNARHSELWDTPTSSSDKFDESMLDEVNQMPEDFEFEFHGQNSINVNPVRKLSNSMRHKQNKAAGIMAPSPTTGTKFYRKDKTVTLFRSSSAKSRNVSFESIDSYEDEVGKNVQCVDQSDEDDYSFITPIGSLNPPAPNSADHADSPLTTISEGSFDSSYSPRI